MAFDFKTQLPTIIILAIYWIAAVVAPNVFRFLPREIAGFVASFFFVLAFAHAYLYSKRLLKKYPTQAKKVTKPIKITALRLIFVGLYFQICLFSSLAFLILRKTFNGELSQLIIFGVNGLQLHFILTGMYLLGGIIFTYLVLKTRRGTSFEV